MRQPSLQIIGAAAILDSTEGGPVLLRQVPRHGDAESRQILNALNTEQNAYN
jgi:hypothetical protein